MGKHQRDKGKRGEIKHRDVLRALGFANAERGQQRHGGPDSPDVRNGIPGCHPEVKFYAKGDHAAVRLVEETEKFAKDVGKKGCICITLVDVSDDSYVLFRAKHSEGIAESSSRLGPRGSVRVIFERKRLAAVRHLEQAEREAPDGAIPYAVLRENGMGLMDEVWMIAARDVPEFCKRVIGGVA